MAKEFKYQDPFPVGKDKTEYYLLTKNHVSVSEFEGQEVLKVQPEGLTEMAQNAKLQSIEVTLIEVDTIFRDFDDFWQPFTLGAGPAPGYCSSLDPSSRERLREKLRHELAGAEDGSITLKARAWAVSSRVD